MGKTPPPPPPIALFASVMRRLGKLKSLACGRARVSDAGHHFLRRIRGESSVHRAPGPPHRVSHAVSFLMSWAWRQPARYPAAIGPESVPPSRQRGCIRSPERLANLKAPMEMMFRARAAALRPAGLRIKWSATTYLPSRVAPICSIPPSSAFSSVS